MCYLTGGVPDLRPRRLPGGPTTQVWHAAGVHCEAGCVLAELQASAAFSLQHMRWLQESTAKGRFTDADV